MTEQEMRELDCWIAENVMGFEHEFGTCQAKTENPCYWRDAISNKSIAKVAYKPTTDPAAAMLVLEKCLQETEHAECIYAGYMHGGGFLVGHEQLKIEGGAPTLPLAICLFARQLFGKDAQ